MTPAAGTWKVHFNSRLGLDGVGIFANNTFTPVDLAPTDVLTVSATPTELPADKEVDQMTFEFVKTAAGADMVLRWIRTEVRVPIAGGTVSLRTRRTCSTARASPCGG